MYSNIPYAEVCASRTRSHTDFVVTVKATKNSGPNDAYFGVTCRKTGPNYFSLAINGNGEYRVYRSIGNVRELLVSGASKAIKKGNVTNSLRASCIGSVLTLEVNNREVVQVLDPYNQFGYFVGLVVGTDAEVGINVTFDNFDSFPP
ncbi:MAG: hypothetical protein ACE5GO_04265 [Anaerolineales bacterium]